MRTFGVDVLECPRCQGRMRLLAMLTEPASIARHLAATGEAVDVPRRSPGRGPPYWKSHVLRRQVLGDEDGCGSHRSAEGEGASPQEDKRAWVVVWLGLRIGAGSTGRGTTRYSPGRREHPYWSTIRLAESLGRVP